MISATPVDAELDAGVVCRAPCLVAADVGAPGALGQRGAGYPARAVGGGDLLRRAAALVDGHLTDPIQLPMDAWQPGVDPFVVGLVGGVADADHLSLHVEQAAAAAPLNGLVADDDVGRADVAVNAGDAAHFERRRLPFVATNIEYEVLVAVATGGRHGAGSHAGPRSEADQSQVGILAPIDQPSFIQRATCALGEHLHLDRPPALRVPKHVAAGEHQGVFSMQIDDRSRGAVVSLFVVHLEADRRLQGAGLHRAEWGAAVGGAQCGRGLRGVG